MSPLGSVLLYLFDKFDPISRRVTPRHRQEEATPLSTHPKSPIAK